MIVYPKEAIIAILRNFFSEDAFYHYQKDQWGNPNVTDHTDLPLGADLPYGPGARPQYDINPILPTRLFIGENYPNNGVFYPAVLVKSGGSKYVQVSFNRNQGEIMYEQRIYIDGYGNQTTVSTPKAMVTAGAWEGSVIIDVLSRSLRSRDELIQCIAMLFTEIQFETLHQIGIVVKPPSISAPSESDDRNDKLFKMSVTLDIRTEWRREIPIKDTVDAVLFTADFGTISSSGQPPENDMGITIHLNAADTLAKM